MSADQSNYSRDEVDSASITTMNDEEYMKKDCKALRRQLKQKQATSFVFYRLCFCGKHTDRSREFYEIDDGENMPEYASLDGIEVHGYKECQYTTVKQLPGPKYIFKLDDYCTRYSQKTTTR